MGAWYTDMKVKLRNEPAWDEEGKMGYVLSRTSKNPQDLIETGFLEEEYSTA